MPISRDEIYKKVCAVLVDTLGARRGSTVMVTTENEPLRVAVGNTTPARLTHNTKGAPVDAVIVGIVDTVEVEGTIVDKP